MDEAIDEFSDEVGLEIGMIAIGSAQDVDEGGKVRGEDRVGWSRGIELVGRKTTRERPISHDGRETAGGGQGVTRSFFLTFGLEIGSRSQFEGQC